MLNITSNQRNKNESLTKILLCIYESTKIKGLIIPSADVEVGQYRVGRSAKWYCTLENSLAVSYKIKYLLKFLLLASCWKNSMNREAWRATVHGVTKSQTRLSTHTCTTFRYFSSKSKHVCLHEPLYTNVYRNFIHNTLKLKTNQCPSITECVNTFGTFIHRIYACNNLDESQKQYSRWNK